MEEIGATSDLPQPQPREILDLHTPGHPTSLMGFYYEYWCRAQQWYDSIQDINVCPQGITSGIALDGARAVLVLDSMLLDMWVVGGVQTDTSRFPAQFHSCDALKTPARSEVKLQVLTAFLACFGEPHKISQSNKDVCRVQTFPGPKERQTCIQTQYLGSNYS